MPYLRTGLLVTLLALPLVGQDTPEASALAFAVGPEIAGLPETMPDGPSVGLLDIDRDGWVDMLLRGRVYWNTGGGGFTRGPRLPGAHHAFGDIDADGDLDVYATQFREYGAEGIQFRHWLLRQDAGRTFTDIVADAGLDAATGSKAHGFLDYDRDGHLDLFAAGYETVFGQPGYRALPDHLWRGDGEGGFTEVTEEAGITAPARQACGVALCDVDNDGWTDIYVAHYRLQPNTLYRNVEGVFEEVAAAVGARAGDGNARFGHSNGVAVADYDHDGDADLFVCNLSHDWTRHGHPPQPRPKLLRNRLMEDGALAFEDVTAAAGLDWAPPEGFNREADWEHAVWEDLDNDGHRDLFVTESAQGGTNCPAVPERLGIGRFDSGYSKLYWNAGDGTYTRADTAATRIEDTWGAAGADWDGDGDVDLLAGSNTWKYPEDNDWFDPAATRITLLRNDAPAGGNGWLTVALTATDRALCGAVLTVTLDDDTTRRAWLDTSYGGYAPGGNIMHLGLGPEHRATGIRVDRHGEQIAAVTSEDGWRNAALLLNVTTGTCETLPRETEDGD